MLCGDYTHLLRSTTTTLIGAVGASHSLNWAISPESSKLNVFSNHSNAHLEIAASLRDLHLLSCRLEPRTATP
jgi:hypothetical protein